MTFAPQVSDDTRLLLISYVHRHLHGHAADIERQRHYACPDCGKPVTNHAAVRFRLEHGKTTLPCQWCDAPIDLHDLIEQRFASSAFDKKVRKLDEQSRIRIDAESRELILVGQALSISAEAGQIFRPTTLADHGIDGEIEFRNDRGEASGKRVYLQLKSGDSHLYRRKGDGAEVFTVKKVRHLRYWRDQPCDVYLVIRSDDGVIRWMNLTVYLKSRPDPDSRQVIFQGEPFTAFALMRLRDRLVPRGS